MKKDRRIPGFLLVLLAVPVFVTALSWFVKPTMVKGDSMQPTLEDGDCLLIDRWSYRTGEPKRFDVVVFPYPYRSGTYYIKRVIALPGETIRISGDGDIYVNGRVLIEHYGNGAIQDGGLAANEMTLGEDEYFVLGDNRNSSVDSREPDVGNIRKSDIVGKGWVCLFPFERFGVLE